MNDLGRAALLSAATLAQASFAQEFGKRLVPIAIGAGVGAVAGGITGHLVADLPVSPIKDKPRFMRDLALAGAVGGGVLAWFMQA